MKVFNGNKFLDENAVQLNFSNGKEFQVREIDEESAQKMDNLSDDAGVEQVRIALSGVIKCDPDDLKGVGLVELMGATDFLFRSLFDMKSATPKKTG